MAARTDTLDLASLRLSAGEGRRMDLAVAIEPLELGSESYAVLGDDAEAPAVVPVELTVSRMTGGGYALMLKMAAAAAGPCMRCLRDAAPVVDVEAREVDSPGGGEELDSPYVNDETLDVAAWARDSFALSLPAKVLCREDCLGLCPICAVDLADAGPGHRHDEPPDPRWAKLRELKLD
jgi:uncharacterized protein